MRRRSPTLQAVEDQLVASGLQPDRHTLKRLLWETAENVVFQAGAVKRKIPAAEAFDTSTGLPIRGLAQQQLSSGTRRLWTAAGEDLAYWSFGAPTVFDSLMGSYFEDATATQRPTFYDFTPYGDWMIVNNSVDPARIWKSAVDYNTFTNAPIGVIRFMKFLNMILAIGYGPRGTQVGWSSPDNITLWTAADDNLAGALTIDEFNTPIRAGSRLGNFISVFSEDQLGLVSYIGQPFMFGQKTVLDGIGAIGKMAVASDTRVNVGVSRAGVWWTDGNSARYIDEGYLSDYLQDNVNWVQGAKIVAARNDYTGCFEFHFPMGDSTEINEAWSWDPRNGGWSPCPHASMMDERRLFEHPIHGSNDGLVLLTDYATAEYAPLALETKPMVMQSEEGPHKVVRMDEVDLLLKTATNIQFRVGCSDEPEVDWTWTPWMAAEAGAKLEPIPELPEAPYWKLAFRSVPGENDWAFNLQGFLLYSVGTGTKP